MDIWNESVTVEDKHGVKYLASDKSGMTNTEILKLTSRFYEVKMVKVTERKEIGK